MASTENIIAICIATYNRPELLVNCLKSIHQIIQPESYQPLVIVVDNDKQCSAEQSFIDSTKNFSIKAYYYVEPSRGICAARNCLLEKALLHDANYIAFIDDDELAHRQWLVNIIKGLEKYKVDIVAGPVVPIKETVAPESFTSDSKRPSGVIPRKIAAGNVLFTKQLVADLGLRFDRYFDFIGGEDFDFFDRAAKNQIKSVWVSNAIIFETILPERNTKKYIIYRHFTGGINAVMRYRRHHHLVFAWFKYLPKIIGKFLGAIVSLFTALIIDRKNNLNKALIKASNAIGYFFGLINIIIERYRY